MLGTTCRLQFNEPPTNYELALKQLNALYRQLKYAVDNTPKYNHIAIVICVSEVNGELVSVAYEKTGKRGRPKKTFVPNGKTIKGKSPQARTHLHCYLAGVNSFSLANQICSKQNKKAKRQGRDKPVVKSAKSKFSVDYCRQQHQLLERLAKLIFIHIYKT